MVTSIANFKGGTGKTTTCLGLGYGLAKEGYRVLMVDMDPQGNLSTSAGIQNPERTIYDALHDIAAGNDRPLPIYEAHGADVIPSDINLVAAEVELAGVVMRETLLRRMLEPVAANYDLILIDTPPSAGLLTMNALACSDKVIIPTTTDFLPVKGLKIFSDKVIKVVTDSGLNPNLDLGGILLTMHNPRRIISREMLAAIGQNFPDKLFQTQIRTNVALTESQALGQPVFQYDPDSNAAADYLALTHEFIDRFHSN